MKFNKKDQKLSIYMISNIITIIILLFILSLLLIKQENSQLITYDEISEVLNCPYCDKVPEFAISTSELSSGDINYYIRCNHEEHDIEFTSEISMTDAINKWNVFVEMLNIANND